MALALATGDSRYGVGGLDRLPLLWSTGNGDGRKDGAIHGDDVGVGGRGENGSDHASGPGPPGSDELPGGVTHDDDLLDLGLIHGEALCLPIPT